MKNPLLQLAGEHEPYRGDWVHRLGPDGQPSGLYSKVKLIVSNHPKAGIWEICDDANRILVVIRDGEQWLEIEFE